MSLLSCVSTSQHETFVMTWTGNERKRQTLWVILSHDILGMADVHKSASMTEWTSFTFFSARTHLGSSMSVCAGNQNYTQLQLKGTPRCRSPNQRLPICASRTNELQRRWAANAVARACPRWPQHGLANQIAPTSCQSYHWRRHTQEAERILFSLDGGTITHFPELVAVTVV